MGYKSKICKHIIDLFVYMPLQSNPVGVGQVEQPHALRAYLQIFNFVSNTCP